MQHESSDTKLSSSEETAVAKARLSKLVGRSRRSLFAERVVRALVAPVLVCALFFGITFLGWWQMLPAFLHVIGLIAFALGFLWSLRGLYALRWPSREEALARIEAASPGLHRPLTAVEDELASQEGSVETQTLWLLHKRRMAKLLGSLKSPGPKPRAYRLDPYALRVPVVMIFLIGLVASSGSRMDRLSEIFRFGVDPQEVASRLDAWVTPPLYTNLPPIYLTGESAALRDPSLGLKVPEGARFVVRSQGAEGFRIETSGGVRLEEASQDIPVAVDEHQAILEESGRIDLYHDDTLLMGWQFDVLPDETPTIAMEGDPEEQLSGALKLAYTMSDDYGVVSAEAHISAAENTGKGLSGLAPLEGEPRPLVEAPQFPLALPPMTDREGRAETIRDLTSHPWAGSEIELTLHALDEAGQEGVSPAYRFTLPQRRFRKPLARAVVEQRRLLAMDARQQQNAVMAFDALLLAPEHFNVDPKNYLGLRFAYNLLHSARSDEDLKGVLPLLWDLALTIEDGDLSMAERALRDAQEALRKALEEGASDADIERLTQELRQALNEYMQALMEQMQRNPQAMQPFNSQQQQSLSQQDLSEMLDRIEDLAKTGSRDAARELLAEMQRMLENLQAGRPQMMPQNNMSGEMMEMLNKLGEMIQKQQQLMDQTHRYNQQGQQGQQGQQMQPGQQQNGEMSPEQLAEMLKQLQQGQGDLAQQLQELMEQLAQNGMKDSGELGQAGDSMGDAQQSLGEGQGQQALGQQGNALEQLRKGAQGMAEQMMGQGEGPGMAQGRSPLDEDPLGRPRRTQGPDFGNKVKVPDEIDVQRARRILEELRKRFADPSRPKLELEYLERLLKSY